MESASIMPQATPREHEYLPLPPYIAAEAPPIYFLGRLGAGKTHIANHARRFIEYSFPVHVADPIYEKLGEYTGETYAMLQYSKRKDPLLRRLLQVTGDYMREQNPTVLTDALVGNIVTNYEAYGCRSIIDDARYFTELPPPDLNPILFWIEDATEQTDSEIVLSISAKQHPTETTLTYRSLEAHGYKPVLVLNDHTEAPVNTVIKHVQQVTTARGKD